MPGTKLRIPGVRPSINSIELYAESNGKERRPPHSGRKRKLNRRRQQVHTTPSIKRQHCEGREPEKASPQVEHSATPKAASVSQQAGESTSVGEESHVGTTLDSCHEATSSGVDQLAMIRDKVQMDWGFFEKAAKEKDTLSSDMCYRHWSFTDDPVDFTHASYMMVRRLFSFSFSCVT